MNNRLNDTVKSASVKKTATLTIKNGEIKEINGKPVVILEEKNDVISARTENGKIVKIKLKNKSATPAEPQPITSNPKTSLILATLQSYIANNDNPHDYVEYIKSIGLMNKDHYLLIFNAYLHYGEYLKAAMFYEKDMPTEFKAGNIECFNLFADHIMNDRVLKNVHLVSILSKMYTSVIEASPQIHDEVHAKMLDVASLFLLINDYANAIHDMAMEAANHNLSLIPKTQQAYLQSQVKRATLNPTGLISLRQAQIATRNIHMDFLHQMGLGSAQTPKATVTQTPFTSNQTGLQRLSQFGRPVVTYTAFQPQVGRNKFSNS